MRETIIGSLSPVKCCTVSKGTNPTESKYSRQNYDYVRKRLMQNVSNGRITPAFISLDVSGRHVRKGSVSLMLAGVTHLIVVRSSKPRLAM